MEEWRQSGGDGQSKGEREREKSGAGFDWVREVYLRRMEWDKV